MVPDPARQSAGGEESPPWAAELLRLLNELLSVVRDLAARRTAPVEPAAPVKDGEPLPLQALHALPDSALVCRRDACGLLGEGLSSSFRHQSMGRFPPPTRRKPDRWQVGALRRWLAEQGREQQRRRAG